MRWALLLVLVAGCDWVLGMVEPRRGDDSNMNAIDAPEQVLDAPAIQRTCKDALNHGVTTTGVITIDPDDGGPGAPFQVYCDMETAGGGWTLVYSYGFANYAGFTNNNNAVVPRPDWNLPSNNPPDVSTTTPLSPSSVGAMPFARWKDIGGELLITSTINNWVQCSPGSGSLVTLTQGTITCAVVNVVVNMCTTVAPNGITIDNVGPSLSSNGPTNFYYFFDGSTVAHFPTHDPCGTDQPNQLKNVSDPRGAIFVR